MPWLIHGSTMPEKEFQRMKAQAARTNDMKTLAMLAEGGAVDKHGRPIAAPTKKQQADAQAALETQFGKGVARRERNKARGFITEIWNRHKDDRATHDARTSFTPSQGKARKKSNSLFSW